MHAFYLPPEKWPDSTLSGAKWCELTDSEARHLMQALRLQVDEQVHILDGQGRQGLCRIESLSKRLVTLELLEEEFFPRPRSLPIMALAFSKATRRGFFMEKAVELGVHEVWLWQGAHSQGKVPFEVKEHWQGQCIAAMKQCGNPWLPTVRILRGGAQELIQESRAIPHKFLPYEGQDGVPMLRPDMVAKDGVSVYVIGPEGGFSAEEKTLFEENAFQVVSLGPRVLRCETAALLCLGVHSWLASH